MDTGRIIAEYQDKTVTLTTERQCLFTTIQTLEADLKCLKSEFRSLASQVKKTRVSTPDNLLMELACS